MSETNQINRVSQIMKHACTAALLFIPTAIALTWWNLEFLLNNHPSFNHLYVDRERFSSLSLLTGFLVSMVPAGILMWGIASLRILFGHFLDGEIFSLTTMLLVRRFARSTLLFAMAHLLTIPILSVVLTLNNPPSQRAVSLSISSNDIFFFFISGLFFAVAWVMGEGRKIAEENSQIV